MSQLPTVFRTAADVVQLEKEMHGKFYLGKVEEGIIPDHFYCRWIPEITTRERVMENYPNCCFNHKVGLPRLKNPDESLGLPNELYEYQHRWVKSYTESKFFAQNKCRGSGTTEIKVVRLNAWKYMRTMNAGRKCIIIAGINEDMAKIFMNRIKVLCDKLPKDIYLFEPKTDFPSEIFFKQGGSIWALPSNPNAVRSLENVGDIDYDEAAQWSRVDDIPVLMAGEPHVMKSGANVNHFSTPAGKKKYFYDKIFDPEANPPTKYVKHTLNWREVVGIPEPDPNMVLDFDFGKPETRAIVDNIYIKRYETDKDYKMWFHNFFPGLTIQQVLDVPKPILDVQEIAKLYNKDRATYDQELDNQFILSENRAFGLEPLAIGNFNSQEMVKF